MTNRNGQDQEHGVAMHSHSRQGEIVLASYELTTHTSAHFLLWRQKKEIAPESCGHSSYIKTNGQFTRQ